MVPLTELAGRYQLEELIAVGGMGEVWRATDQVLGRWVAVKLLRPEYLHDDVTLLRFRAEARHTGLLNHPGIAQVYDYQDASPQRPAYLVMELVSGPSLAGVLAEGKLGPRRTADVLAQAAAALHAAHTAGVLHRDVKPGNLLLAGDGRVKVTDFGIAQSSGSGHLTRTGALVGTTGYLAPERVSGRSATVASDLYALGIVGYECLAGEPPFQGEPLQVALAHREQDLPGLPPGCLGQPGGTALAALIADLTARDPAARPASAAVVAERAGRIRDGQADAPESRAGAPGSRAGARDSRAGAPGGLPAPTRSVAVTAPSSAEPGHTPPAGARRRRLAPAGLAAGLLAAGLLGWLLATAQAGPGPGHPAQARSSQPASPRASPRHEGTPARASAPARARAPARSSAPAQTGASAPAPSASPAPTDPGPPATGPAGDGTKVAPGRAKHHKGAPPGHG
jgi:tRNA A-37 threonylcarbamoyl transferase component Bud32